MKHKKNNNVEVFCVLLIFLEDHWLGLKTVFALTKKKSKKWTLRVDLWDHEGGTAFAEYNNFKLGTEKSSFKLHVRKYRGNAGTLAFFIKFT